jgi:hypothetical protein
VRHTQEFEADSGWSSGGVGAPDLKTWLAAVAAVRGGRGLRNAMPLEAAIKLIAATSPAQRSAFAAEIWRRRRGRHGPTGHPALPAAVYAKMFRR